MLRANSFDKSDNSFVQTFCSSRRLFTACFLVAKNVGREAVVALEGGDKTAGVLITQLPANLVDVEIVLQEQFPRPLHARLKQVASDRQAIGLFEALRQAALGHADTLRQLC